MKTNYTCGDCYWADKCLRLEELKSHYGIDAYSKGYKPFLACMEFIRYNFKRNDEANCGNCPYGSNVESGIDCRYTENLGGNLSNFTRPACRHHPDFWQRDDE